MANTITLKRRIASVKGTKQITKPLASKRLLSRINILNDSQFEKTMAVISNEFFGANKTDSTKVKSSGPEGIYKPSLSDANNFVNTTSHSVKKSDPAKQSPRSPKAISSPIIAVSATIVNKAKKGLADG